MLEGGGEPRAPDVQAGGERKKRKWLISTMNSKVSATNFHSQR